MIDSTPNQDTQTLLNKIVLDYMAEQKRKRRTRLIKRVIIVVLIAAVLILSLPGYKKNRLSKMVPHVGLIEVEGTILDKQSASGDNIAKSIANAYSNPNLKALVFKINSPGGSPVQADYIYNLIQYSKKIHPSVKVYAVCVDICASAAYYIASAADEIYANPASMVGSIGVIYNGFGFVNTLEKLGISRRFQTAGRNKDFLDPFAPENDEQKQILQKMLNQVHQQFIDRVKQGRGNRLKINNDTFSGLIWTGEDAKEQGLIDGFASTGQIARDIVKTDKIVDYSYKHSMIEIISKNIGTSLANQLPIVAKNYSRISL